MVAMAKVTTAFIEINKNISYKFEVNTCCIKSIQE